jgi:hypothetical protein
VRNSTIRRLLAAVTGLRLNFGYIASFANLFPPTVRRTAPGKLEEATPGRAIRSASTGASGRPGFCRPVFEEVAWLAVENFANLF